MVSFYTREELEKIGFHFLGEDVRISKKASFYGAENISVGNHVRIDDFCILSGKICINNYIHIAAYSALYGGEVGIIVKDFANISSRVCIYALSDDYSGNTMTNPMVPDAYKAIEKGVVVIAKHVILGSGCTVLPGVTLAEGTAVGAMSLIKRSTEEWSIYAGIPAEKLKPRVKGLLNEEKKFLKSEIPGIVEQL